jgi:hypothetical protein
MTAAAKKPRTKQRVVEAPIVLATPWMDFARDNHLGQGRVKRDIAAGKLKVIQAGRKLLVTAEAGRAYLNSFPVGPFKQPANFINTKEERAN